MSTLLAAKSTLSKTAKVYSYVRFSTGVQRKGRGKKRQSGMADQWCADNGYRLEPAHVYDDLGVSAHKSRNSTHGELRRFLNAVEEGDIEPGSILLVESLDRLSRDNINKALELFLSIINSSVIVVTLCDGAIYRADADPHSLMAQMMISLAIFLRANDESRMKSQRKADVWKAKRIAAQETGSPIGGRLPRWLKVENGEYVVIEDQAKLVRDIFNSYVHESKGLHLLSEQYGIPVPTISYWMTTPAVIGTLIVTEGDVKIELVGHYPAIVKPDLFALSQQKRAERYIRRSSSKRVGDYINLFSGLITDPKDRSMILRSNEDGMRSFFTKGYIVRADYLEQVICGTKLAGRFMAVKEVQPVKARDEKKLAEIDQAMKETHATMMEEPVLGAKLLPLLRKLQAQKTELMGTPTVVRENVSFKLISGLMDKSQDKLSRLKLKDLVQQTIRQVKITKVESNNWFMQVHGTVSTMDGLTCPLSYAYNTRRHGFIITDNSPRFFLEGTSPNAIETPPIGDELKAELNKFPLVKKPK